VPTLQGLMHQNWLKPGALVTVETDATEATPEAEGYALLDRRTYGRVAITFLKYAAG
jgi:16S rRNA G966 N2-methylase RsmD